MQFFCLGYSGIVTKNNQISTIDNWGPEYTVAVDIIVHSAVKGFPSSKGVLKLSSQGGSLITTISHIFCPHKRFSSSDFLPYEHKVDIELNQKKLQGFPQPRYVHYNYPCVRMVDYHPLYYWW